MVKKSQFLAGSVCFVQGGGRAGVGRAGGDGAVAVEQVAVEQVVVVEQSSGVAVVMSSESGNKGGEKCWW
ncbi:hypothetical protein Tco_1364819 [Tanacetum coccineum]